MTTLLKMGLAGACALGMTVGALPAQAAWVGSPAAVETAKTATVMKVDWRDRRGYRGGYRGHRHGGNAGGYAAAGVLGLAAGALIAGSANRGYDDEYYDAPPRRVYVERRPAYRQCEVVRYREDRYGDPVRVITYRPC